MSYFDFFISVNDNILIFIAILFYSIAIYYFVFKKNINSLFDPLFLVLLSSCFGTAVVLFLYVMEKIENIYFYSYILTQSVFYLGFFLLKRTKSSDLQLTITMNSGHVTHDRVVSLLFYVTGMINIAAQLITYATVGIPIFLESRLEIYVVGGGFGVINRMIQICFPISVYCTMYFLLTRISNHRKEKLFARSYLLLLVIFGLLSGSRSFMLPIVYGFYFFLFLNRETCKESMVLIYTKHSKRLIAAIIILLFISLGIKNQFSILGIVTTIIERAVSYGDIYFAAYPNGIIKDIQGVGLVNFLFGDILRTLRLVPPEFVQQPIGFEIYNLANNTVGILNGPNPRHNVIGFINWGFTGSILFSFLCGMTLSLGRNLFFNPSFRTHQTRIAVMLIYAAVVNIETDPAFSIATLNNILFMGMAVAIVKFIMGQKSRTGWVSNEPPIHGGAC